MPWAALGMVGAAGIGALTQPGGIGGTGPSVQQGAQSTLSPSQQALQQFLTQNLQSGIQSAPGNVSNIGPYSGQFTAPLDQFQNSLLTSLFGPTAMQGGAGGGAVGGALSSQGPTMAALNNILSGQPQDYSQYFKTNVAAPMEDVFQNQTLPSIKGAFARSAGGTYSGSDTTGGGTGFQGAVTGATKNMDQQMQQALSALSTQAITNASRNQVAGIGLAPSVSNMGINTLMSTLPAAALPQQTQQSQLTAQYSDYLRQIQQLQSLLGTASGTAGQGTQQPFNIVSPGSPGVISPLLSGASAGFGSSLANMSSGSNNLLALLGLSGYGGGLPGGASALS